jgi:hypothetical protein
VRFGGPFPLDLSNCSTAEVEKIVRAVPEFVTTNRKVPGVAMGLDATRLDL